MEAVHSCSESSDVLLGESPEMSALMARIPLVASARRTTLITGPTGTGKEILARKLHTTSRPDTPYVPIHCGALPETLAEAELFGHTRGAFTGALQARPGLIRSANGGTLFFDEVDSLSPSVQIKLLRFLETGEYRPVGSDRSERASVWVLAATNRDLREHAARGAFREDLLYRLDVVHLRLPPLRLRRGDIELLARHFLSNARPELDFTPRALAAMREHSWPGNVRELKHRIERASLLARSAFIDREDLELGEGEAMPETGADERMSHALWRLVEQDGFSLAEAVAYCERTLIEAALRAERENRTRAAQRLGIHVRTIFKKLNR